ncbi:MAG: topoisomerase DNA-binding C4 zinc finger domain-containing protein, partial [Clostridia bacterium]|nr:topoisomerase DNA-binding C4 zinc finger domain-containing protein [Clostridia bacterium]
IVDSGFTAEMETELDNIESGESNLNQVLSDFWGPFEKELASAEKTLGAKALEIPVEETEHICEKCGSRMIVKNGRFGKFAACPNYPKCKNTKPLASAKPEETAAEGTAASTTKPTSGTVVPDMKCEKCGADMVMRNGRYGSFYACSRYPECDFTKQKNQDLGVACPKCGQALVTRHGRRRTFYGCSGYPSCDFSSWDMPTNETCPDCGGMLFVKKNKGLLACAKEGCGYSCKAPEAPEQNGDGAEEM